MKDITSKDTINNLDTIQVVDNNGSVIGLRVEPHYLNVCAHCGECLKQIVSAPDKVNVVLHYKNDKGNIVEWKPNENLG